jgi:hypothetical protein
MQLLIYGLMQSASVEGGDMARMFVRHDVTDYPAWRKVYDSIEDERAGLGVTGHAVFCAVDDERDVTAWHDFGSIDAARAFAASPMLHEAMERAGVAGAPQVWFTSPA